MDNCVDSAAYSGRLGGGAGAAGRRVGSVSATSALPGGHGYALAYGDDDASAGGVYGYTFATQAKSDASGDDAAA